MRMHGMGEGYSKEVKGLAKKMDIELKSEQEDLIYRLLEGCHTIINKPTGWGKSIIYQIASLVHARRHNTLAIVICPLIALSKDQVYHLNAKLERAELRWTPNSQNKEVFRVETLHSSMLQKDWDNVEEAIKKGLVDLLYVAPERITIEFVENTLVKGGRRIGILTYDEAHTLVDFREFRPTMEKWPTFRIWLNKPTLCLASATITHDVQDQIQDEWLKDSEQEQMLDFQTCAEGQVLSGSITVELQQSLQLSNKMHTLRRKALDIIKQLVTTGILENGKFGGTSGVIIYTTIQKDAEELAKAIKQIINKEKYKILVDYYHAGRGYFERDLVQGRFMRGDIQILVSTSAFGMGLDKPDVKAVFLANVPNSFSMACQMIGRAGRSLDTSRAYIMNCTHFQDNNMHLYLARESVPKYSDLKKVLEWFLENDGSVLSNVDGDKEKWIYERLCKDKFMEHIKAEECKEYMKSEKCKEYIKAEKLVNWLVARELLKLIKEAPRMRWIIKLENFSGCSFRRESAKCVFLDLVWEVVQHEGFKDDVQGSPIGATYSATWEKVLEKGQKINNQFDPKAQKDTFSEAWKKLEELKLIKYKKTFTISGWKRPDLESPELKEKLNERSLNQKRKEAQLKCKEKLEALSRCITEMGQRQEESNEVFREGLKKEFAH